MSAGFTLIEVVVVLVLSSLMIGAAVKGQGLIDTVAAKRLEQDFRTIPALLNAYQDKFKRLPGDDANVGQHLGLANADKGDGDGIINGTWYDEGTVSDSAKIWRHLHQAGLLSDGSFVADAPVNVLGSRLGIQGGDASQSPIVDASGHGLKGSYIVCSSGIPGNIAQQLDIHLDDGNPATGSVMIAQDPGAPYRQTGLLAATLGSHTDTDIRPDLHYVVCMGT